MEKESQDIEVRHAPERQRFEAVLGGDEAVLTYTTRGQTISLDHTYVPEGFRGQGIAAALTRAAAEEARRRGWKIQPRCSYAVTFFERHPEWADLLAGANGGSQ